MDIQRLVNSDMSESSKQRREMRQFPRTPFPFENTPPLHVVDSQPTQEPRVEITGDTTCSECESSESSESSESERGEGRALTPDVVSVGQTPPSKDGADPREWKEYVDFNDQTGTTASQFGEAASRPNDLATIFEQDLMRELIRYQNPQDLAIEEAHFLGSDVRPTIESGSPYGARVNGTTTSCGHENIGAGYGFRHEGPTEFIQIGHEAPHVNLKRPASDTFMPATSGKKSRTGQEPPVYLRAPERHQSPIHPDFQIVAVHGEKHCQGEAYYKVTWKDSWVSRSMVPWIDNYMERHGRHWDVNYLYTE